jgi:hypothetical protein
MASFEEKILFKNGKHKKNNIRVFTAREIGMINHIKMLSLISFGYAQS